MTAAACSQGVSSFVLGNSRALIQRYGTSVRSMVWITPLVP